MNLEKKVRHPIVNGAHKIEGAAQTLFDYIANSGVKTWDDGYRRYHERTGATFNGMDTWSGKFMIRDSFENLKVLEEKLLSFMKTKQIDAFKLKNETSPIIEEYRNLPPPLCVYCKARKRDRLAELLKKLVTDGKKFERLDNESSYLGDVIKNEKIVRQYDQPTDQPIEKDK